MKFTVKSTAALQLPEGKTDHVVFDDDLPGFGVRLRAGGSRMWIFQYALGKKQRRVTLGSAKAIDFAKARDGYVDQGGQHHPGARDLHAMVRLGQDPAGQKIEGRKRAAETFGAVCQKYLASRKPDMEPGSYAEIERHLLKYAKPLHGLQVGAIELRTIAGRVSAIGAESGPVAANRMRSSLSAFFAWAMREGLADRNPVTGTNKFEERTRERVLTDTELSAIWNACQEDQYGAIIRLLMMMGQRADEIASLKWSEIGDDAITLPGARTKNGRQHIVPLADPVLAILGTQERRTNHDGTFRDFVFGIGQCGFSGWSKSKERLDARVAKTEGKALTHWTPHDLRRSAATGMANLGVPPHIIEAVLNHVSGHKAGVAGIYNRASYEPEKRQALVRWAAHVMAAVEGKTGNVTPLRRPA